MLNFNEVVVRGAQRAAMAATDEATAPPHAYVIEPLVVQLMGPDYCADNGAMLVPHEAQNLAGLLSNMAAVMDGVEHRRLAAEAHAEELEIELGLYKRRLKRIAIGLGAVLLYVAPMVLVFLHFN